MSPVASSLVVAVVVSKLPGLPTPCSLPRQCVAPVSGKPAAVVPTDMVHIDLNTKHHCSIPRNIYIIYKENDPLLTKEMPRNSKCYRKTVILHDKKIIYLVFYQMSSSNLLCVFISNVPLLLLMAHTEIFCFIWGFVAVLHIAYNFVTLLKL